MNNKTILVNESIMALQKCKTTLMEISKSCCMPERSPNIKGIELSLDDLIVTTSEIEGSTQNAQKCISDIGELGSKVGFLYATCCTTTREPMYQNIFKELMLVHVNMWGVLGHSH